jgi:hypothetical protein
VALGRGGGRSTGAADGGHHGHRGSVATPFSSIAGASTNHMGLAAAAAVGGTPTCEGHGFLHESDEGEVLDTGDEDKSKEDTKRSNGGGRWPHRQQWGKERR